MSTLVRAILMSACLAVVGAALWRGSAGQSRLVAAPQAMPEFSRAEPAAWLNSTPLHRADLRGKVVLLEVWTFGCVNCQRTVPWLRATAQRHAGSQLQIVGIHTPEFAEEHDRDRVQAHLRQFGVSWPNMLDNDLAYWNALNNRYWPALYLVDKQGRIRAISVGEVHEGDAQARRIETQIAGLLRE